ncbi:hypothetical protein [Halomonas borealis]|uniref:hypothetical protein n=1 Tax=Halomonas borealis TaxID=2508710 RepID=UPI0010A0298F|nr:hypothetical protein [Halomonas borealis]
MKLRSALIGASVLSLWLSAGVGLSAAAAPQDPLAAEVCDVTRQRLAEAQPQTPGGQALAADIAAECEGLGRDYSEALKEAAVFDDDQAPAPTLRSPYDADEVVRRGERVRVALWSNQQTVDQFYTAESGTTPPGKPVVWVTLAPELKQWCSGLDWSSDDPQQRAAGYQRISQRLGLPPYALNDRFVTLWVEPERLMRPCADPGTEGHACRVELPESLGVPDLKREAYAAWFTDNVGSAYSAEGAPWTREGWTYDWGVEEGESPHGVSEFMLAPRTEYEIEGRYKAEDYCTL